MKQLLFFLALVSAPLSAQSPRLSQAIAAGEVGERFDGYMGFVASPAPELRSQVNAINLRRRNLYIDLAVRRNVTADVVGLTTACTLLAQLPVGEAYMLNDKIWRRHAAGQPAPTPDYCH